MREVVDWPQRVLAPVQELVLGREWAEHQAKAEGHRLAEVGKVPAAPQEAVDSASGGGYLRPCFSSLVADP